jgi:hypothetical protein
VPTPHQGDHGIELPPESGKAGPSWFDRSYCSTGAKGVERSAPLTAIGVRHSFTGEAPPHDSVCRLGR